MAEDTRSFEEVKAEQDRLWTEAASVPEPEGYAEWFRAQVEIAVREANDPNAVTYAASDVDRFMAERRAQRDSGLLAKAS